MYKRPRHLLITLLCICSLLAGNVCAQTTQAAATEGDTPASNDLPTPKLVATTRASVEIDTNLDDARRGRALEMLDQAADWLEQTGQTRLEIRQLQARIREAPKTLTELQKQPPSPGKRARALERFIRDADLAALEQRVNEDELALVRAREQQKQALNDLARLLGSKQISDQIETLSGTLAQIRREIKDLPTGEPEALAKARLISLQSREALRQSESELLKLTLGNQSLLTDLAQAQRDATASEIARLQSDLATLNEAATSLRESQAAQARQQAELLLEKTANLPKPLQEIADENARNRVELVRLVSQEKQVSQDLATVRQQLDEIKNDFERTRQRVAVVGASEAIGNMLYRRREGLPSLLSYSRNSAQRKQEINHVTDRQITIEELLRERGNVQDVVQRLLPSLAGETPPRESAELEAQCLSLAQARRDALNELQKVYSRYVTQLTALDLAERQLVAVSSDYIGYINDQLIWIPNGSLLDADLFSSSLLWFFSPTELLQLGGDLFNAVKQRPAPALLVAAIVALLGWKRKFAKERLPQLAKSVRKIRSDAFSLTLWALFYTLVRIGLLPASMVGLGLLMGGLPTAYPITSSAAEALVNVGITLTAALLLFEFCRAEGVGPRHLRWNTRICEFLRSELRWAIPVLLPLRFLIALSTGENLPSEAQYIGRLVIISLLLTSLTLFYRLLRRHSPLMTQWRITNATSLLLQLQFLWFPLLLLLTGLLAVIAALGYLTLSLKLLEHIEVTFWFFVGLFFLKELLLRYLFVAERRLRYENALRKREELRAQREQEPAPAEDEAAAISVEIPELNFDALSEQAKRLVRFGYLLGAVIGSWMIWEDLLPALDFFGRITLPITTSRTVDGVATLLPLTLRDLLVGLIALLVTLLAAKNLPGVLEITLLQRLPLDAGARYALTTLLQYLIAGIGLVMAFATIGFQWSSIQWLVAALGVGLGFGLQEIVANFISGIILLFERPIRVGDVVTLDDTTGVVSRIRIRATTITNYDKQELLIPNKEFITGRVVNWTLSDKVNRIIVTVGVAYGSDVSHAMALMLEAAHENENVLTDPNPVATFEAFGDNALTLLLRTYLGSMENRLATITALHEAINRKFNQAGINIAFPQRDLHLDTTTPLDIRISRTPRS